MAASDVPLTLNRRRWMLRLSKSLTGVIFISVSFHKPLPEGCQRQCALLFRLQQAAWPCCWALTSQSRKPREKTKKFKHVIIYMHFGVSGREKVTVLRYFHSINMRLQPSECTSKISAPQILLNIYCRQNFTWALLPEEQIKWGTSYEAHYSKMDNILKIHVYHILHVFL